MEHCNFIVIVCPVCKKRTTETCGVYAMQGGFRGCEEICEECRKKRELKKPNASVTGAKRTVDAVLDIPCTDPCALGDLGHCGRTDHERRTHCEKRFNAGLPQLSNAPREGSAVARTLHADVGATIQQEDRR